ncbi:MAG: hypothetical protein ACRCUM_04115, partial [Mycoplasmoidaceae bacterium]
EKLENFVDIAIKTSEDLINLKIIKSFVSSFLLKNKNYPIFLKILNSMGNGTYSSENDFYTQFGSELLGVIDFQGSSFEAKHNKKLICLEDIKKWIKEEITDCNVRSFKTIIYDNIDIFIEVMKSDWILSNDFRMFSIPIKEIDDDAEHILELERQLMEQEVKEPNIFKSVKNKEPILNKNVSTKDDKKPNKVKIDKPIMKEKNDELEKEFNEYDKLLLEKKVIPIKINEKIKTKNEDELKSLINEWLDLMIFKDIWNNIKKGNVDYYKTPMLSKLLIDNSAIIIPNSSKKSNSYEAKAYALIVEYKQNNKGLESIKNNRDFMNLVWKDNIDLVNIKRKHLPFEVISDIKKLIG